MSSLDFPSEARNKPKSNFSTPVASLNLDEMVEEVMRDCDEEIQSIATADLGEERFEDDSLNYGSEVENEIELNYGSVESVIDSMQVPSRSIRRDKKRARAVQKRLREDLKRAFEDYPDKNDPYVKQAIKSAKKDIKQRGKKLAEAYLRERKLYLALNKYKEGPEMDYIIDEMTALRKKIEDLQSLMTRGSRQMLEGSY